MWLLEFGLEGEANHERITDVAADHAAWKVNRAKADEIMLVERVMDPRGKVPARIIEFDAGVYIEQTVGRDVAVDRIAHNSKKSQFDKSSRHRHSLSPVLG